MSTTATSTQAMLNQATTMLEDQNLPSQLGFYSIFPSSMSSLASCSSSLCFNQSLKSLLTLPSSLVSPDPPSSNSNNNNLTLITETLLSSTTPHKQRENLLTPSEQLLGGPQLLSLQRSTPNLWAWGELTDQSGLVMRSSSSGGDHGDHYHHHHQHQSLGVSALKMKKIKGRRKVREPRFCFKTMSDVDVLDDGYKWRKYGQKVVKNTQHPRSYYRCTQDNCRVKKRVERLAEDPRMVITTYEGRHVHSPSQDVEDSQASSQLNDFFW
ncbi:probable WRKY transcription factor 13 [Syzygium oleosum]|uniref:probable WRKY transcription factor 13 n=1 Tax=Syzygium oleosum TaxID=219896 RepID=UPI0011D1F393|nr:probable WRKY transcription factor 13 [Syzygium oleosum]